MRVLLVDDDEYVLVGLARMFRAAGRASPDREAIEVIAARNIEGAEAHLREGTFDVIVADHHLGPGERGTELLARAAVLCPQTCRLLFSARVLDRDALAEAEAIPVDGVINKPTPPDQFVAELQRFVTERRTSQH